MKFMGSKARIAKHIVPIIQSRLSQDSTYIEPFVGGANVIDKISCKHRIGYDINKYLIALLQHVQSGGELPDDISRGEYSAVRSNMQNYPVWYVGCVGFLASYNGRFFDGGYAGKVLTKAGTTRDYYDEAKRNLLAQDLLGIEFICADYKSLDLKGCVIYSDPPYEGVKQFRTAFNTSEFWDVTRRWSNDNEVIVSELSAPGDFRCVWEQTVTRTVDNTKRVSSIEKLFISAAANESKEQAKLIGANL